MARLGIGRELRGGAPEGVAREISGRQQQGRDLSVAGLCVKPARSWEWGSAREKQNVSVVAKPP